MYLKRFLFTAMLLCTCLCIYAQNGLDSLQRLKEVVIVAKPFQEVIPSRKMTGKELEQLNSHSVADALRYFAGVQIKDYGGMGGLKTINVRNMGSIHVGVFYNGIAIGNVQNGVVDLGRFSLDDVEEISMYNGQRSEILQSAKDYASASSVYIRAKRPRFTNGKNTNLTLKYKTASIQTTNPSLRLEQKLSRNYSLSLSSEYLESPGRYKFHFTRKNSDGTVANDTTAYRQNSDISSFRVESSLYGVFDNSGIWETNLYYYQSDRGLPGAIVKNKFKNGERLEDKNFFMQSAYTRDITNRYKMQLKAKFAFDYTHYNALDTIRLSDQSLAYKDMLYDNKYYQQEVYLTAVNKYKIQRNWDVALSLDLDYNKLNASYNNKSGVNDTLSYGTPFSFPQRYSLIAALGSSLDIGTFKAQASVIGTFVHEEVRNNTKSPDKREITPAIFLGYQPFIDYNLNLRFFYKRIFRMPTFNDLYYSQIGYSLLKPEYTNQFNFGFSFQKEFKRKVISEIYFQADAYYMNIKDKIVAAPTGSFFRWMMTNMGKVEGYGLDASTNIKSKVDNCDLGLVLNYSYSVARDFTKINGHKKTSYGDQIPYTPWHSGSAILNAGYKGWYLNYSFIYIGERYNGAVNNIPVNRVNPWFTHDMSVQKEIKLKGVKLKGSVEVNNLLDQYYEVVKNYPMPGRNFKFILSLNF